MNDTIKNTVNKYNEFHVKLNDMYIKIGTLQNSKLCCEKRLNDLLQMGANAKIIGIEVAYIGTELEKVNEELNELVLNINKLNQNIQEVFNECGRIEEELNMYRITYDELQNVFESHKCAYRFYHEDTNDTKFRIYTCSECGEIVAII